MIQRVSGVVRIVGADEATQQKVTAEITKLADKFPENNLGSLGGIDMEEGRICAWFGRGMYKLRAGLKDKEVDETFFGPQVEVFIDESKLDARRSYQEPLVAKVSGFFEGLIDVPPGGGKTVIASMLVARLQRRCLIIVHTTKIADQFRATLKALLGVEAGFIGQGERDIRPITVGMIQSVRSTDPILKNIGLLIIDEAHHISAPSYLSLLKACPARFRYGMTGTVEKTGDEERIVYAAIGPVLAKIETGSLQAQGYLNKGTYRAVYTNTVGTRFDFIAHRCFYYKNAVKKQEPPKCPTEPLYPKGPICTYPKDDEITNCIYARAYHGWVFDKLATDPIRNKKLVEEISKEVPHHPWMIVLTHRKKHAAYLAETLKAAFPGKPVWMAIGTPEQKAKDNKLNVESYRSQGGILVAMSQSIGEGFDAPKTSLLVRAMPAGGKVPIEQQTARAMRPQEVACKIIDFVDKSIPDLNRWWMGRQSIYKKMGFTPEVTHVQQQKELF